MTTIHELRTMKDISLHRLLATFIVAALYTTVNGQIQNDTISAQIRIQVQHGKVLITKDTVYIVKNDTVLSLDRDSKYRIIDNPDLRSQAFYDSLRTVAYHSKFTRELYDLLLITKKEPEPGKGIALLSTTVFTPFTGKIIGNIRLIKVNLIDGQVNDTISPARTTLGKLVSKTHINTRNKILYNSLLFKTGDNVSPDVMADNERILRSLAFIHDARINVIDRGTGSDTVDVLIVTQDNFEYELGINVNSLTNFSTQLTNNSFLGTGKQVGFSYLYNADKTPSSGYLLSYKDRNFNRTFTEVEGQYSHYWDKEGPEINIVKNFLTPKTKWAFGLNTGITSEKMVIDDYTDTTLIIPYRHYYIDAWAGRSFIIGKESDRKNFIITVRVLSEKFINRPFVSPDSDVYFFNRQLYLTGLGYNHISFFKSTMLRSYNLTDDIPTGYFFELTPGLSKTEFNLSPYIGLRSGIARFTKTNTYLYSFFNFGGFYVNNSFKQGALDIFLGLYTPLTNLRKWHIRNFVNLRYTVGLDRYFFKYIDLNDEVSGISKIKGNKRLSLNMETVYFRPLSFYGFQIALYSYLDIASIGTNTNILNMNNVFASFGGGIRLRNENLVIQNLDIRIGYIPKLPNGGGTFTFGFSDSDPSRVKLIPLGKPEVVRYR